MDTTNINLKTKLLIARSGSAVLNYTVTEPYTKLDSIMVTSFVASKAIANNLLNALYIKANGNYDLFQSYCYNNNDVSTELVTKSIVAKVTINNALLSEFLLPNLKRNIKFKDQLNIPLSIGDIINVTFGTTTLVDRIILFLNLYTSIAS